MHILIADDDPITLDTVAACLAAEGFLPLTARDGAEALALWRKKKPALLCLDIMMPRLGGYEVCRAVRAEDTTVPILFLSAKSEEVDVVVGLELGADDFLRKPCGKHELLARIRATLRRSQARERLRPSFTLRDLTVFPRELRAERAGLAIDLTPRETAILELLHERTGEVVDRDTLLTRCWGLDYFPESRTLDMQVAKLRRRIERDPTQPEIIETARGTGYRYRAK